MQSIDGYIGITGFTNRSDVRAVLEAMPSYTARKLMVGILASQKTLQGNEHKDHPNRYPMLDELVTIPVKSPRAFTLIHYYTEQTATLFDQLAELSERCGSFIDGFQLNIPWPDPAALRAYRIYYPGKKFVLQITDAMFAELNNDPKKVAELLCSEYDGLVEHILLDGSLGEGKMFIPQVIRKRIEALKNASINMGIGIAGGINIHTLRLISSIAEEHPDINTDAEGGVHTKSDHFDTNSAIMLVKKQGLIFS